MLAIRSKDFREQVVIEMQGRDRHRLGGKLSLPIYQDIELIYPMLTYIRQSHEHPDGERTREAGLESASDPVYHYKCKHYVGGNCTIYDIRPRMCSSFGADERGCGYSACTWSESRARHTRYLEKRREDAENNVIKEKCDV